MSFQDFTKKNSVLFFVLTIIFLITTIMFGSKARHAGRPGDFRNSDRMGYPQQNMMNRGNGMSRPQGGNMPSDINTNGQIPPIESQFQIETTTQVE